MSAIGKYGYSWEADIHKIVLNFRKLPDPDIHRLNIVRRLVRLHALVINPIARFDLDRLQIFLQTDLHHTNMTFHSRKCWPKVLFLDRPQ